MGSKGYFNPRLKRYDKLNNRKREARSSQIQFGTRLDQRGIVRYFKRNQKVSVLHTRRRAS